MAGGRESGRGGLMILSSLPRTKIEVRWWIVWILNPPQSSPYNSSCIEKLLLPLVLGHSFAINNVLFRHLFIPRIITWEQLHKIMCLTPCWRNKSFLAVCFARCWFVSSDIHLSLPLFQHQTDNYRGAPVRGGTSPPPSLYCTSTVWKSKMMDDGWQLKRLLLPHQVDFYGI